MGAMAKGDQVFIHHSSVTPAGIVGLATVARTAYPDPTALDPDSHYFDPRAKPEKNPWVMVDVKFSKEFPRMLPLDELRKTPGLHAMPLVKLGMRLSVQPVTPEEFSIIMKLASK